MRRGTPLLTVDDLSCSGANPLRARPAAREEDWRWSRLGGGGAVRQAHDCAGVDGRSVCKWPNGLLAPAGRVERVNARVAKEELRATPVVGPAQPAIRQTTPVGHAKGDTPRSVPLI